MDRTLGLSAVRSGVRIPGGGTCSLRTTAVDASVIEVPNLILEVNVCENRHLVACKALYESFFFLPFSFLSVAEIPRSQNFKE